MGKKYHFDLDKFDFFYLVNKTFCRCINPICAVYPNLFVPFIPPSPGYNRGAEVRSVLNGLDFYVI